MKLLRRSQVLLLLALAGCGPGEDERPAARVFAAASLTAAFEALAAEFEAAHPGMEVELHFAGTPQLVLQVREGAPVDVFASADEVNMGRVVETGRVVGEPRRFARNRLTIVTRPGNPAGIESLADLAREELTVVLCGPEVPAGRYARQALEKAGVAVRSASDEPSVKAVLSKVALGEADAGIVYVTDVIAAGERVGSVAVPDEHNVIGSYPIALLDGGAAKDSGLAFLEHALSPEGRAVLARFGFEAP